MKTADKMYRDMLLIEAKQSKHPRLYTAIAKGFWWMNAPRIGAIVMAICTVIGAIGVIGSIVMIALAVRQGIACAMMM